MLHALFRSRFTIGSLPPYFLVRLIEIDNILYNRVMALDSYQNFVSIYLLLDFEMLTIVLNFIIFMRTSAMLSRAQNTFHHNPRLRGPVSSNINNQLIHAFG